MSKQLDAIKAKVATSADLNALAPVLAIANVVKRADNDVLVCKTKFDALLHCTELMSLEDIAYSLNEARVLTAQGTSWTVQALAADFANWGIEAKGTAYQLNIPFARGHNNTKYYAPQDIIRFVSKQQQQLLKRKMDKFRAAFEGLCTASLDLLGIPKQTYEELEVGEAALLQAFIIETVQRVFAPKVTATSEAQQFIIQQQEMLLEYGKKYLALAQRVDEAENEMTVERYCIEVRKQPISRAAAGNVTKYLHKMGFSHVRRVPSLTSERVPACVWSVDTLDWYFAQQDAPDA